LLVNRDIRWYEAAIGQHLTQLNWDAYMAHSTIGVECQKPQPTGDKLPPAAAVVGVRDRFAITCQVICIAIELFTF
jgi:hypothetical protein